MASTVSELYNCMEAKIPEELTRWHITEDEIQEALAILSQEHAALEPTACIADGDSVSCVCVDDGPEGRTVLLYPGRKLPGAEEAETAVLGWKAGERFTCKLGKSQVTLEVREALRLVPHTVDDELVRLAEIEGVSTLSEYQAWFTEKRGAENREKAGWNVARAMLEAVRENSPLEIDESEMAEWTAIRGRMLYDMMMKSGHDPHIPEDGLELLSDEEALAKVCKDQETFYRDFVLFRYMSQRDGYTFDWDAFEKWVDQWLAEMAETAAAQDMTREALLTQENFVMKAEGAYIEHAQNMLFRAAEKFLEV